MNRMLITLLLSAGWYTVLATGGKEIIPASLKSAMVYRSGAELVHTATAHLQQGNNEVIIEGVSNKIDMNSVQIGASKSITIMSVEFSTDFMRPASKSALVRRLEDSLKKADTELKRVQALLRTDEKLLELLNANKEIGGSQTGLSVTELTRMMDYYKSKSIEISNEITDLREKEARVLEKHSRILAQIKEEEQKNNKTVGKLVLQLYSPVSTACDFTVSYITPTAYWFPAYDLKVESVSKPIRLVYKAKLVQTSGIDWKQVKLALSTSMPAQSNKAPDLKTWFLAFQAPSTYKRKFDARLPAPPAVGLDEVVITGHAAGLQVQGANNVNKAAEPLYVVDGEVVSAAKFHSIDKNAIKSIRTLKDADAAAIYGSRAANGVIEVSLKYNLGDYVNIRDNALHVVFNIDLPYDVPSNGKEQHVVLKDFTMPAHYHYYSAPHVDKEAYLLGEMSEWESLNLLPGDANIIFEGTFVGKTTINPGSTLDTLRLTLGRDKRVVVTREKLADFSSVKFLGSNKKQTFTYEITVKNNKKEKIQMVIKDQHPISTNKDIEVELLQHDGAAIDPETGILTWKTELAPNESRKFRVSYSVKYPKDKLLNL